MKCGDTILISRVSYDAFAARCWERDFSRTNQGAVGWLGGNEYGVPAFPREHSSPAAAIASYYAPTAGPGASPTMNSQLTPLYIRPRSTSAPMTAEAMALPRAASSTRHAALAPV